MPLSPCSTITTTTTTICSGLYSYLESRKGGLRWKARQRKAIKLDPTNPSYLCKYTTAMKKWFPFRILSFAKSKDKFQMTPAKIRIGRFHWLPLKIYIETCTFMPASYTPPRYLLLLCTVWKQKISLFTFYIRCDLWAGTTINSSSLGVYVFFVTSLLYNGLYL